MENKMKALTTRQDEVKSILDGTKTQFRRPMSDKFIAMMRIAAKIGEISYFMDNGCFRPHDESYLVQFAPFQVGETRWVRETFQLIDGITDIPNDKFIGNAAPWKGVQGDREITWRPVFRADGELDHPEYGNLKWKPSTHMPKWAARIFIKPTRVWAERCQDISESDAKAESVEQMHIDDLGQTWKTYKRGFESVYDSCYPNAWKDNIWNWACEFERCEREYT